MAQKPGIEVPFFGRDPSWLAFNERVTSLAERDGIPLFDRLRFLSISGTNLDEYFMKRVARFKHRREEGTEFLSHDGKTIVEQYDESRRCVLDLQHRQATCWTEKLVPSLEEEGIVITRYGRLARSKRAELDAWFQANVFPILTPLAVDQGHRFPFISNLSTNIGVLVSQVGDEVRMFARLKIPPTLPAFVQVSDRKVTLAATSRRRRLRFVPIIEVILANLELVFPGMKITDSLAFRVTRSTGMDIEDEDDSRDILENVEAFVQKRRFAEPVRLEVPIGASRKIVGMLRSELDLDQDDVYERPGLLDYGDVGTLLKIDAPELETAPWRPVVPPRLAGKDRDIFAVIRERDLFVHHPYESFHHSVEHFIASAARDPNVLAIKQTVYRTTEDSPFIQSLIHAAQEGKQVACIVELRARFDEDRNLQLVRRLERHGVHVTFGILGLKTHCKLALVVRREGNHLQSYAHIGTGNYHSDTAKLYTDCGIFTCDPSVTADATHVFNFLTGRSHHHRYDEFLVAPVSMRERFYELIDAEIAAARRGQSARIMAKMNQLEDRDMIRKLYEASRAGVLITLIIRGFCCLRPGVKGLSENIRVVSVVGRFLEHSRIFHFAGGESDPVDGHWYLGSGDWMSRNMDDRVEVIAPVADHAARRRLIRILEVSVRDRVNAWELQSDGSYRALEPTRSAAEESPEVLGTFEALCRDALSGGGPRTTSDYFLRTEAKRTGRDHLPSSIETQSRRMMRILVTRPWFTAREAFELAGIPEPRRRAVRKELLRLGLAVPHKIGRTAVLEPTEEAVARVEQHSSATTGNAPYPRRWLSARLVADMSQGEAKHARREVEHGEAVVDLVTGKKEATRRAWKFVDSTTRITGEITRFLELPFRLRTLVAFDGKTMKKVEKVIASLPKSTTASVEVRSFSELVEATRSLGRTAKKKEKRSTRKRA